MSAVREQHSLLVSLFKGLPKETVKRAWLEFFLGGGVGSEDTGLNFSRIV